MLAVLTVAGAVLLDRPVEPIVSVGFVGSDAAAVAVVARAHYSTT